MTKLDGDFWGNSKFGGIIPGNGGGVRTTNPKPVPNDNWRPESGQLMPAPGYFPGSEPGGPASGEPVMPERGKNGI